MAGGKMRADQLEAVWFAAGTAAFIACIERAVVVSLFAHWRVWAFLALNLLLLAILFTSKSQIQSNEIDREDGDDSEFNDINTKKPEELAPPVPGGGGGEESAKLPESGGDVESERKIDDDGKEETHEQISKEELNQRVEAFIAMFRQHLISDRTEFLDITIITYWSFICILEYGRYSSDA